MNWLNTFLILSLGSITESDAFRKASRPALISSTLFSFSFLGSAAAEAVADAVAEAAVEDDAATPPVVASTVEVVMVAGFALPCTSVAEAAAFEAAASVAFVACNVVFPEDEFEDL